MQTMNATICGTPEIGRNWRSWINSSTMLLGLAWASLMASDSGAATFDLVELPGQTTTRTWTDPATWNSLDDPGGVPAAGDTANLTSIAWPYGMTVNAGAGWGAHTINITGDDGNQHRLSIGADGAVDTINYVYTSGNQYSWHVLTGGVTLTLRRWLDGGTSQPGNYWSANTSTWAFTDDAVWQYATIPLHGGAVGTYAGTVKPAARLDFSGATSVELRRNPNNSLLQETLTTVNSNLADPISIGRADNGDQLWTVGAGSNPLLMPGGTSQSGGIRKVGTGDVFMQTVDLMLDLTVTHPSDNGDAISSNGRTNATTPYSGEIHARSLRAEALINTTTARQALVLGALHLHGETGQQAGGAASGRSLEVLANSYDLHFRLQAGGSATAVGQVIAEPGAGAFYFGSTGSGKVKVNINNDSRDVHTHVNTPLLVANDLVLGPGAYLHDRNDWAEVWSQTTAENNAGGRVEFRGDFRAATSESSLWRTENTTFHAITDSSLGNSMEVMSADYGTAGPGVDNFLIDALVLGRDAAGTDYLSQLVLRDFHSNSGVGGDEALYVNSLQIYNDSVLWLGRKNLYYYDDGTSSWIQAVEGAYTLNGSDGWIMYIPEPSSLALLALAGLADLRRRKPRA